MTHRMAPSPNTSLRGSIWSMAPMACSGGMYAGVPSTLPARVASLSSRPESIAVAATVIASSVAPRGFNLLGRQDLGESPVHDLHFAEGTHHDVDRLQVPVNDSVRVRVPNRLAHLLEDGDRVGDV